MNFIEDGYVTRRKVITSDECQKLLSYMISDWGKRDFNYIHGSDCRLHSSLKMTSFTVSMMRKVLLSYRDILNKFLDDRWLVEFSSICTFPGAVSQQVHRDQSVDGKLVTIFVNLTDVDRRCGPLKVIPRTHYSTDFNYDESSSRLMTLSRGSSVMMDSRLLHSGTANTSHSKIRPVFYFSFGAADLKGPVYSIKSSYWKKYKLDDFTK